LAKFRLKVLVDNCVNSSRLLAEHGLSFFIEYRGKRILFDTGQGQVLGHNAEHLGIQLASIDIVVLSHGHYDHSGGLTMLLNKQPQPVLYCHPHSVRSRYSRKANNIIDDIGMPNALQPAVKKSVNTHWVESPTEILPGLWCTGPIPRSNDFEDTGGDFVFEPNADDHDEIEDDQALYLETDDGTVVILGCAHAGVINTLDYIYTLTNKRRIHTLIGGMHLVNAGEQRFKRTIARLKGFSIENLMPCHCTGLIAQTLLRQAFPKNLKAVAVGSELVL